MRCSEKYKANMLASYDKIEFDRGNNTFLVHNKMMQFQLNVYSKVETELSVIVGFSWDDIQEKFPELDDRRAVWCYDFDGNLLWMVDPPYYINRDTGEFVDSKDDAIDCVGYDNQSNKILVYGRLGYELDPKTGAISNMFYLR